MRYGVRVGCLSMLLPLAAAGQPVAVGAIVGLPISSHSQEYGLGCLAPNGQTCGPNDFLMKPYTIGAVADVRLPLHLSVEAGFLYERLHRDVSQGLTVGRGTGYVNFGEQYGAAANAWLFPFLLRYTFRERRRLAPFVDAGATLRHLGPFDGQGIQMDFYLQPQPVTGHIESAKDLDAAITAGGGVRWRVWMLDIAPEIRFLHWTSPYNQPARNEAMLMLRVAFPAVR